VSLKQLAEKRHILIADRVTDLLHTAVIILQQTPCGRNAQLL
jgi:hypothetical protein